MSDDPQRDDWLDHDYTRKIRGEAVKEIDQRLTALLSTCSQSTDPHVTARLQDYRASLKKFDLFKIGENHGGPSGVGRSDAGESGK